MTCPLSALCKQANQSRIGILPHIRAIPSIIFILLSSYQYHIIILALYHQVGVVKENYI